MRQTIIILSFFGLFMIGCAKFVDVAPPKNEVAGSLAFADDQTAQATVVGLYANMNSFNYQFANVLGNVLVGMSADEIYYAASFASFDEFRYNQLTTSNSYVGMLWSQPYALIYQANSCISGIRNNAALTPAVRNQLLGEALFVRSFCYFYLINYFGDVPLLLTTDYQVNNKFPRTDKEVVYDTLESDLHTAIDLMPLEYTGGAGRVRPNKATAQALAARVSLYRGEWAKASTLASAIIDDGQYTLETDLNKVFLAGSQEAIWQLQSINPGRNTFEGNTMLPVSVPYYRLYPELINSFEPGDKRLTNWIGTDTSGTSDVYYPFKYKVRISTEVTENSMVFRLAEQYLIRAEARAEQGQLEGAIQDLDIIRRRAGLKDLAAGLDKTQTLAAIARERRLELFTEWGHRWMDLKRTGQASVVLQSLKPDWQNSDTLYPIPLDAMSTNATLTQNPGYGQP